MAKTIDLLEVIKPEDIGDQIANYWTNWDGLRQNWKNEIQEIREYIFATDTSSTTNGKLPWSNKTTIPKLCQIRDNLLANYEATMFPKRKWLEWEAASKKDNDGEKTRNIRNYMLWNVEQLSFKEQLKLLLQDYIDTGNCFVTPEWVDLSTSVGNEVKSGFSGARPVRLDPLNIVFDPTATSFAESPKIIRSMMTIGQAKEILERMIKTAEEKEIADRVWKECMEIRGSAQTMPAGDFAQLGKQYSMDGFGNYHSYLSSNYVELLTFYGDLYDINSDTLYKNYMFVIMDRCHVIFKAPHPYPLAEIPIYRAGWRERQNNLWAMSPLANLVGMQYRLDHIENLKADLFDLTAFPPLKIKGLVQEFEWGPMEKIHTDSDGDVELMTPELNTSLIDLQIQRYETLMEEMAGSPKEAMGFRTPGEKTAYEVQRLENAASRIFQNKVSQFEETILEPLLNSMLVYAKKYLTPTTIRIIDSVFNAVDFSNIQASDLSANGRLKPIGARVFAEKAERIQNINNFAQSGLYQDPEIKQHFSSIKIAKMVEQDLDLEEYELVTPFVRLSEQAEAQNFNNANQEQVMSNQQAPAGLAQGDASGPIGQ